MWPRDHNSPSKLHIPGDRFIPTRSLMDIEHARSLLMPMEQRRPRGRSAISPSRDEYIRRIEENLTQDSEGNPFRMLVFRGSPSKCSKNLVEVDEEGKDLAVARRRARKLCKKPVKTLDAPNIPDNYYTNLLDWGKTNILAVILGSSVYLWHDSTRKTERLLARDYLPTSVAWSADGKTLAVGFGNSTIEIWDAATLHHMRTIEKHRARVGSLSWNCNILTSGSRDSYIINHDVRIPNRPASYYIGHKSEVCGLKWSDNGNQLASGGNDQLVNVWQSSNTSKYLHRFRDHSAAVKALAWCPFRSNFLASGGGTGDHCIKIWNVNLGKCVNSIDTGAQVCALEWNRHHKEILSAHGFSKFQLNVFAFPSMHNVAEIFGHTGRILNLSQSPDGSTVVSAGADELLHFWKIFEPPSPSSSRISDDSDSPFSLKSMHIR